MPYLFLSVSIILILMLIRHLKFCCRNRPRYDYCQKWNFWDRKSPFATDLKNVPIGYVRTHYLSTQNPQKDEYFFKSKSWKTGKHQRYSCCRVDEVAAWISIRKNRDFWSLNFNFSWKRTDLRGRKFLSRSRTQFLKLAKVNSTHLYF